jgi:hypothetical protein
MSSRTLFGQNDIIMHQLTLLESPVPVHIDGGVMDIDVLLRFGRTDNAPASMLIEILDGAFAHRTSLKAGVVSEFPYLEDTHIIPISTRIFSGAGLQELKK